MTARQRHNTRLIPAYEPLPDLPSPESWTERALCAETDPDAFFPEKGGPTWPAKQVCRACDVQAECLEYALSRNERWGVWGGLSEQERRPLRKARAA